MKWHPNGTVTVDTRVLVGLASAVVHAQEARSAGGHAVDWIAFDSLLTDPLIISEMEALRRLSLLPVPRTAT